MKTLNTSLFILMRIWWFCVQAVCVEVGDPDDTYEAYNTNYLAQDGTTAYYKKYWGSYVKRDWSYTASHDIYIAEDAYRRKGDQATKTLVNNLCTTWLHYNAPPWHGDGWNDDIAWYTIALMRGYQITGNASLLSPSTAGNDYVFARGWDTEYNDGGIWETNPEYLGPDDRPKHKESLSNGPNAQVACLIYQSTHNATFLDRCKKIYAWQRNHLWDDTSGKTYTGVQIDGTVGTTYQPYNAGPFIEVANLLWEITGDVQYYKDAKLTLDYSFNSSFTNGKFNVTAAQNFVGANEFARAAGNFVRDNNLWSTYYTWLSAIADAILSHRNKRGICHQDWDVQTPDDDNSTAASVSNSVAWIQYVPAKQPSFIEGLRSISNRQNHEGIDSGGLYGNGMKVVYSTWSNTSQTQRWLVAKDDSETWIIVNVDTWQALEASENSGSAITQSMNLRAANQRWTIDALGSGWYKLTNNATGLVLECGATDADCAKKNGALTQSKWSGRYGQQWFFHAIRGLDAE